jgi:uncharacterized paraquat-inducible protein A
MVELRGYCPQCERWFAIPSGTLDEITAAHCPACASAGARFEVRLDERRFDISIEAAAHVSGP